MTTAVLRTAVASACALLMGAGLVACRATGDEKGPASILLFDGTGASRGDVSAIRSILHRDGRNYSNAGSFRLNRMTEAQLREYRLLIVPGGNFVDMGNSLTPDAAAKMRAAVRDGLNYLGICAGAFLAGNSPYNGLNLTSGVRFGFYSAENQGIRKAAVAVTSAAGQTLDQYWEDGPQLSGWGAVIAKYPDGMPAVAQGEFGKGWVILTGVHPEAPAAWRRGIDFRTPAETDNAYAAALIRAALYREPLTHY